MQYGVATMIANRLTQVVLTGAVIATFACAPSAPAPTREPTTSTAPPQAKPAAASPAPAAPAAAPSVFRVAASNPPTLDPGLAADAVSVDLITQLFEGLVRFDESGVM